MGGWFLGGVYCADRGHPPTQNTGTRRGDSAVSTSNLRQGCFADRAHKNALLPTGRLGYGAALGVHDGIGKLTKSHVTICAGGAYVSCEFRHSAERNAGSRFHGFPQPYAISLRGIVRLRVEDADGDPHFLVDDADGLGQVGIIRDDHQLLAVFPKRIHEHVGGDIDVRTLLLHLHHVRIQKTTGDGMGKPRGNRARQVVTVVNAEIRESLEGADVCLLPLAHGRIARPRGDHGSEVSNPVDVYAG